MRLLVLMFVSQLLTSQASFAACEKGDAICSGSSEGSVCKVDYITVDGITREDTFICKDRGEEEGKTVCTCDWYSRD